MPYTLSALSRLLRRMGRSWQKARPAHPKGSAEARELYKRTSPPCCRRSPSPPPGKTLQLWCEDEAREGQKGRTGHRWFTRGERPPGHCDKRFLSTYIFAAVRPGTDDAFALVLPDSCCPRRKP